MKTRHFIVCTLSLCSVVLSSSPMYAGHVTQATTTVITFHPGGGGVSPEATTATSNEVRNAQRKITRIMSDLRRNFEMSPELRDARAEMQVASNAYAAAATAAKASLLTTPAYRDASERINQADQTLVHLRMDDRAKPEQFSKAISDLLNVRTIVTKLESDAMNADASVMAARQAWVDANAKLLDLQRNFDSSVPLNADFRAAKSRLEGARKQLARD